MYVHAVCCGTPLRHKCFGACHTEQDGASGCVSNTTVHIQIRLMYSDSRHTESQVGGTVTSRPFCGMGEKLWIVKLEGMLKEAVMTYFKTKSQNSPATTEENPEHQT
jgi:hypothetical protein